MRAFSQSLAHTQHKVFYTRIAPRVCTLVLSFQQFLAWCHPYILPDFYTCFTHFFSHKYSQDTVGLLANLIHECSHRYSAYACMQQRWITYYCVCAIRTKWQLRHPETLVELSVSLFDSFGEFICIKGSSLISYRIYHRL